MRPERPESLLPGSRLLDVLPEPVLEALLRVEIVQRAFRLDEFDQPRGVFLDELLAHRDEIGRVQHFARVRLHAQQVLDGRERGAGELMRVRVVGRRELGQHGSVFIRE